MLQGSSALQSIPNASVKVPQLRVTATANRTVSSVPSFLNGVQGIRDAIIFNNRLVVVSGNNTGSTLLRSMIRTFSLDGATLYSGVTLIGGTSNGQDIDTGFLTASLLAEGATLNLFFTSASGVTQNILRLSSTDGSAWGGTVQIYSRGLTPTVFPMILDLAAVGSSQVYFLESFYSQVVYVSGGDNELARLRLARDSSGWGTTDVGNYPIRGIGTLGYGNFISRYNSEFSGYKLDGVDHLFVNRMHTTIALNDPPMAGQKTSMSQGLFHYRLKENNLFSEEEIISPVDIEDIQSVRSNYFLWNSRISKGASLFYMGLRLLKNIDTFVVANDVKSALDGVTIATPSGYDYAYSYSADLNNWSSPIPLSVTPLSYLGSPIVAGTSTNVPFEAMVLGTSYAYQDNGGLLGFAGSTGNIIFLNSGGSPMDISQDVVSYTNTNNQRVNLTLGNYK